MLDSEPYDTAQVQDIAPRLIAVIAGAIMLKFGFMLSSMFPPIGNPVSLFTIIVFYGAAFLLLFAATTDIDFEKWGNPLAYSLLGVTLLAIYTAYVSNSGGTVFGTDGILFSRYAVDLVLSGQNPYAHSMEAAFDQYAVSAEHVTYKRDASIVTSFSYPSLAFLWFIPQALLGIPNLNYTTVVVLLATLAYLIHATPSKYAVAPFAVLFADPSLLLFSYGGVFDILWTLPLLVGMRFWADDRLITGAFIFGLAFATKQTPWFLAPFLAIWVYNERDTLREVLIGVRNCAAAGLAGFLLPNLPFLLWSPQAWMNGVMTPVSGGVALVKQGQGLTFLSVSGLINLPKTFYTLALLGCLTFLLISYAMYYNKVKWMVWVTPAFILWFNYRSLQNYFVFFIPVAYLAVFLSLQDHPKKWFSSSERSLFTPDRDMSSSGRRQVVAGTGLLIAGGLTGAGAILQRDSALNATVSLDSYSDPFTIYRVSQLTLTVTNEEAQSIEPEFHFIHTESQTHMFWGVKKGPTELSPGETATYVVQPESPSAAIPYKNTTIIGVNDSGTELGLRLDPHEFELPRETPPRILNPMFEYWSSDATRAQPHPYRWTPASRVTNSSLVSVAEGEGVNLTVDGAEPDSGTWTMVGLQQRVRFPSTLHIEATPHSVLDEATKYPTTPTGLEFGEGDHRVWVVFADVEEQTTLYRDGDLEYSIVYVPASPGERVSTTVEVDAIYEANEWERPPVETYSLDGVEYNGRSGHLLTFAAAYPNADTGSEVSIHSVSTNEVESDF